ncbi:hypothetical protein KR018_008406, partial [Drosophila ironensis]
NSSDLGPMEVENAEAAVPPAEAQDISSPLNISCKICKNCFQANDVILCTSVCGHVFHQECLNKSLVRSSNCPQCYQHCHHSRIHRIYLNFAERGELDDSPPPPYEWVAMDLAWDADLDAHIPHDGAVQCATDEDGNITYVARVYIQDELLPAAYVPSKKAVIASWGCHAAELNDGVELLVLNNCDYSWVAGEKGSVPPDALVSGYSNHQETTYTGRGLCNGVLRLGKVHPSHQRLYIASEDQEVNTDSYEVLVLTPREPPAV